jgi:hypothetical protein
MTVIRALVYDGMKQVAMDIEQKLEALTQTVELLARMHLGNETLFREHQAEYRERSLRTDERLAQLMETMNRLANIVEAEDQRLDDLESGQ